MNIIWIIVFAMVGLLVVLFAIEFNYEYLSEVVVEELCNTCSIDNPNDLTELK